MIPKEKLLKVIHDELNTRPRLPHRASALGYNVFLLSVAYGMETVSEFMELAKAFRTYIGKNHLDDLAGNQMRYAMRLADSADDLEYEEMHKLFSICDEVEALRQLNLHIDKVEYACFEESLRRRFRKEPIKARLVAEDKRDKWSKDWWWYSQNSTC